MKNYEEKLNKLFDEYVADDGASKTVGGEIVSAISRIGYRFNNDGDRIGVRYGNETCNAPARYLQHVTDSKISNKIDDLWGFYYNEAELNELISFVVEFLENHTQLFEKENKESFWDYEKRIEDENWDDYDEWDDYNDDDYYEEDEEDWEEDED